MPNRTQVCKLLTTEPVKVGHWCGFKDLTELHNKWLRAFLYAKGDMTLQAHRGSYKTTVDSIALALLHIIHPDLNMLFFRKTDTDTAEVLRQVAAILENGAVKELAKALWGRELTLTKQSSGELNTTLRTSLRGASPIVGLGINTSITGKHGDIIFTDDIVNVADRTSKAERERTKRQYMELQNIRNKGGRFINTGTPWHVDDAFSLMPNVHKFSCYDTGLLDTEAIKRLRSSMTDSLFAANYELKHVTDENALFRDPQYTSSTEGIYEGKAHIDAAYGGEDYTAYTIMKETEDGYIGYGRIWQKHVDACLDEIETLHKYYRAGSISCETNGDKGYLAKELRGRGFIVNTYAERANKFVKIATHLRSAWGSIKWLDATDPDYILQILDYTENAEHDDAPDSAASVIRQYEKNPTIKPKIKPVELR